MFRRRSAPVSDQQAPAEAADTDQPKGYTAPKDRPTPKRKESARFQQRHVKAPQTRKEAYQQYRERQKRDRARAQEGMKSGDERYIRPQDRGPARAMARDYIDARRTVSENFLYLSLLIILVLFIPSPTLQLGVTYALWPLILVSIIGEGFMHGRGFRKLAGEYFPASDLKGSTFYIAMRMLQIRRLRLPKPRVKPGDPVPPPRT